MSHAIMTVLSCIALIVPMLAQSNGRNSTAQDVFVFIYASASAPEVADAYDRGYQNGHLFEVPTELVNHDDFVKQGHSSNALQMTAAIVSQVAGGRCLVTTLEHTYEEIPFHDTVTNKLQVRRSWLWSTEATCTHYLTDEGSISWTATCGNNNCAITQARNGLLSLKSNGKLESSALNIIQDGKVPIRFAFRDGRSRQNIWIACQELDVLSDLKATASDAWDNLLAHEKTQQGLFRKAPEVYAIRNRTGDNARGIVLPYQFKSDEALIREAKPVWMLDGADPYYMQEMPGINLADPMELSRQMFFFSAQVGGAAAVMQQIIDSHQSEYETFANNLRGRIRTLQQERQSLLERRSTLQLMHDSSIVQRTRLLTVLNSGDLRRDQTTGLQRLKLNLTEHRSVSKQGLQNDQHSLYFAGDPIVRNLSKYGRNYAYAKHDTVAITGCQSLTVPSTEQIQVMDRKKLERLAIQLEEYKNERISVDESFEMIAQSMASYDDYTMNYVNEALRRSSSLGCIFKPIGNRLQHESDLYECIDRMKELLEREYSDITDIRQDVAALQNAKTMISTSLAQAVDSILLITRTYRDSNYIEAVVDALLYKHQYNQVNLLKDIVNRLENLADPDTRYGGHFSQLLLMSLYDRFKQSGDDIATDQDLEDFNEDYLERRVEQAGHDDLESYISSIQRVRTSTDSVFMIPLYSLSIDVLDNHVRAALKSVLGKLELRLDEINKLIGDGNNSRNPIYSELLDGFDRYLSGIKWLKTQPAILSARDWIKPIAALRTNIVTPVLDDAPADMREYVLSAGTARRYSEQPDVARSIVKHAMLVPALNSLRIRQHYAGSIVTHSFIVDIRRGESLYGCYNWLTELTHCPITYGGYGSYDQGLSRQYRLEYRWNPMTKVAEVSRVDHLFPMK